jgi:hypothetical protein
MGVLWEPPWPAKKTSCVKLESDLNELRQAEDSARRQVALLMAIITIFREIATCQTENEVAQVCLSAAEKLTDSPTLYRRIERSGAFRRHHGKRGGMEDLPGSTARCRPTAEEDAQPRDKLARPKNHQPWIIDAVAHHADAVEKPQGHPPVSS